MRYIIYTLFCFISLASFGQKRVIYDENVVTRPAAPFRQIEISGGIDLYLSQSDTEAIAVSAGDVISRDAIVTRIENGVLKIYTENSSWKITRALKKRVAYVSCKTLDKLTASGSSDVIVDGSLTSEDLTIRLSGASDLKGTLNINKLSLTQSGASDATLQGKVTELEINVAGSSDVKAYELFAGICKATASGSSDIKITVQKEINATASGSSSIYFKGEGTAKTLHSSGSSNISKKG